MIETYTRVGQPLEPNPQVGCRARATRDLEVQGLVLEGRA